MATAVPTSQAQKTPIRIASGIGRAANAVMTWTAVLEESALPEGTLVAVYPLGLNVLLARVDGEVRALSGACLHMGCPLANGALNGHTVTCPCHDWRFDLRTGEFVDAPELRLAVYKTRFERGKILVEVESQVHAP